VNPRDAIKRFLPPILVDALRRSPVPSALPPEPVRFFGDFASWSEAERASTGYSAEVILARTREAVWKVKRGEAAYERDSVVSADPAYPFPLLAGLLRAAVANEGALSVLDFGGALGSAYVQCRSYLSGLRELRWSVVEQPAHVSCGRAEFEDHQLKFYKSIAECLQHQPAHVLLLSSVLQYLPEPWGFLEEVLARGFGHVVVERTPFLRSGRDRLTVQQVPEWIYPASYPAWFFSEARFRACFAQRYELVAEYAGADVVSLEGETPYFKGFQFQAEVPRDGA
jgi:putative methyltransferase (TIGR04325 family)